MRLRTALRGAAAAAGTLLAASLLVPLPATAVTTHTPVWDNGVGGERYVALGDSFASGPGIAPQRAGCSRSEINFPTLVATALGATSFTDASCGGAKTVDLAAAQASKGVVINAPQLDALGPDTTLVTFGTLGGNDLGLVDLAMSCVRSDCGPKPGDDAKYTAVRAALATGVEAAGLRAPSAQIVMVGYGTYLPENGCPSAFADLLSSAESNYIQNSINRLSDVVADVAREKGLTFVDLRAIPGAVERTVCAPANQQWIRGINTYEDGSTLHPSACGMKAMAQQVVNTIKTSRSQTPDAFDASCVSAGPGAAPGPTDTPTDTPADTPTDAPTQEPAPMPKPTVTRAERLAHLKADARSVKFRVTCTGRGSRTTATLRITGGKGAISKVAFRVGAKRVAVDRSAPWSTAKKASTLRKHLTKKSSRVHATVTLRDGGVSIAKALTLPRRGCLAA